MAKSLRKRPVTRMLITMMPAAATDWKSACGREAQLKIWIGIAVKGSLTLFGVFRHLEADGLDLYVLETHKSLESVATMLAKMGEDEAFFAAGEGVLAVTGILGGVGRVSQACAAGRGGAR